MMANIKFVQEKSRSGRMMGAISVQTYNATQTHDEMIFTHIAEVFSAMTFTSVSGLRKKD